MSRKNLGTPFALILILSLSFVSACERSKPLDRAARLQQEGHPDQALEVYRSQVAKTPEYDRAGQAELQFRIGECLLAMNRTREAFSAFNKAVEIDDRHNMAHLRLGQMYLLSGSVDHATEEAQAILNRGDGNLDALALLGAAASASGNDSVARNAFEDVLERDPSRIKVALSLAELLNRRGETQTARLVLLRAATAQPRSASPYLALGRLEEMLGHIPAAEDAYRKAVSVEDSPDTNLRLAQFLERTAHIEEAKLILRHVDALRPDFRTAHADFEFISNDFPSARGGYLVALNGLSAPGKASDLDSRSRTVTRLIEADLAGRNIVSADSPEKISPVDLASKHLEFFQNELDPAGRAMLAAEIALVAEDLPAARVHADAAVQLAPDSATAQYLDGLVKMRLGDEAGARTAWETAMDADSSHIPTRLALGQLSLAQGDPQDAQSYVVPVVREEPANLEALLLFGRVLIAQKDFGSARVIANRAAIVAPNSPAPDLVRGEIALAEKNLGMALISYQKAVIRDPNSEDAVDGLAQVYRSGRVSRAMLVAMEKIARQEPQSSALLEISGRLFAEHGWDADARRCFESALKIDPTNSSIALQLSRVLVRTGDYAKAARYAVLIPGISQVLQGAAAEQRGDKSLAITHYEAAVRAGDRTSVAANNLAWIYASQGSSLDRALDLALRAVELAPKDAGVLDTLGFVYLQRRQYSEAIKVLERAREMARGGHSDDLPEIERHLRAAYLDSGQPELAASLRQPSH